MVTITTTAYATIRVPRPDLYEWLVPGVFDRELDTVMKDEAGFAGITRTTGTTGPWNVPGSTRIVHQYDGTYSRETVLHATSPDYFAYRLTEFSSLMLKLMAREAGGRWWFTDAPAGGTDVKWTYSAEATSILAAPFLAPVLKLLWNRSMKGTLSRIKARAETELPGAAR